jgi:predicted transporter
VKVNEAAVFKWVVIVGAVVAFLVAVALLISSLVGAILFGLFLIVGGVYGYRWTARKWRASRR